jgi:hypothetical protein
MKQISAVEWLVEHLKEYGFQLEEHKNEILKAKELEKEQIVNSHLAGAKKMIIEINGFVDCSKTLKEIENIENGSDTHYEGLEYYDEKFK